MKMTKDALMTAFSQMLDQFPESVEKPEMEDDEDEREEGDERPLKPKRKGLAAYMERMA
jgi:hypothetical protein